MHKEQGIRAIFFDTPVKSSPLVLHTFNWAGGFHGSVFAKARLGASLCELGATPHGLGASLCELGATPHGLGAPLFELGATLCELRPHKSTPHVDPTRRPDKLTRIHF